MAQVKVLPGGVRGIRGRSRRGFEKATFSLEPRQIEAVREEAARRMLARKAAQADASEIVREAIEMWLMFRTSDDMKGRLVKNGQRAIDLMKTALAAARARSDADAVARFEEGIPRTEAAVAATFDALTTYKGTASRKFRDQIGPEVLETAAKVAELCASVSAEAHAYLSAVTPPATREPPPGSPWSKP